MHRLRLINPVGNGEPGDLLEESAIPAGNSPSSLRHHPARCPRRGHPKLFPQPSTACRSKTEVTPDYLRKLGQRGRILTCDHMVPDHGCYQATPLSENWSELRESNSPTPAWKAGAPPLYQIRLWSPRRD